MTPGHTAHEPDADLAFADALFAEGRPYTPLPEAGHARVKRRLKSSSRGDQKRRRLWLRRLAIAVVTLACGAAFGIALDRVVMRRPSGSSGTTGPRSSAQMKRPGRQPPPAPEITEMVPAPAQSACVPDVPVADGSAPKRWPARVGTGPRRRAHAGHGLPAAEAAMPPRPPEPNAATSTGPTEESLLASALRALRAEHHPESALVALDAYQERFPQGRLALEANALRADALLALHRDVEALACLDRMPFLGLPRELERQVQRGELRASAGRWEAARRDFASVLARTTDADGDHDLVERALWGRCQSLSQLGDRARARSDAEAYLRRFPKGRFVERARALLDETSTEAP